MKLDVLQWWTSVRLDVDVSVLESFLELLVSSWCVQEMMCLMLKCVLISVASCLLRVFFSPLIHSCFLIHLIVLPV